MKIFRLGTYFKATGILVDVENWKCTRNSPFTIDEQTHKVYAFWRCLLKLTSKSESCLPLRCFRLLERCHSKICLKDSRGANSLWFLESDGCLEDTEVNSESGEQVREVERRVCFPVENGRCSTSHWVIWMRKYCKREKLMDFSFW